MRRLVKSGLLNRKQKRPATHTFRVMTDCDGPQSKSTNPDGISCPDNIAGFTRKGVYYSRQTETGGPTDVMESISADSASFTCRRLPGIHPSRILACRASCSYFARNADNRRERRVA